MTSLKLLVKNIVANAKDDEEFFNLLVKFLDRNRSKRDILSTAFKRILIDESKKIYS